MKYGCKNQTYIKKHKRENFIKYKNIMDGKQAQKPKVSTKIIDEITDYDKNPERKEEYEFLKKLKRSIFMITINSNRARFNEAYEEKFKKFHQFLFSGQRILGYMTCKHCATGKCSEEPSQVAKCVKEVDIVVKYEISPPSAGRNANQLHSHVFITAEHNGSVQIDISKVKKLAYKFFGYKLYISVRGAADTLFAKKNYVLNKAGK